MRAILLSSDLPIAPGTLFQMRIAKTTSIASATQPPGLSPQKVGSASDIELGFHGGGGIFGIDGDPRQPAHHFARCLRRNDFDLGTGGSDRVADPGFGGPDLEIDLVRRG